MPTIKLSDTQLVILSTAAKAGRPIGRGDLKSVKAKGAALTRAVNALVKRGLLKEVSIKPKAVQWRNDKMGDALGLVITAAGFRALGIEPEGSTVEAKSKTKQQRLIELLSGDGTTITQLGETLDWLPHTVRAALTRLRQRGVQIERARKDEVTRYRIAAGRRGA